MTTVGKWIEKAPPGVKERFELVNGRWKEREMAGWGHQDVSIDLIVEFRRRGLKANGGVLVFLPSGDRVVPDALVIAASNPVQPGSVSYVGVPDLAVEVLAADNDAGEDTEKKVQYARAGVRHYWLVRLKTRTVELSVLIGEEYSMLPSVPLVPYESLPVPHDLF